MYMTSSGRQHQSGIPVLIDRVGLRPSSEYADSNLHLPSLSVNTITASLNPMSVKRSRPFEGIFPARKRPVVSACVDPSVDLPCGDDDISVEIPNDTKAALLYLESLFPSKELVGKIPVIILKHQLYSIVHNKTTVDRQLNVMWEKNEVRLFKLLPGSDEFAVVTTRDYVLHVKSKITDANEKTAEKFLNKILPNCIDVSLSRSTLVGTHKLTENDITQLISMGVLAVQDVGSWWLSIPGAGVFMKNFMKGRKALVRMIKSRRYNEILLKELESRGLSNQSKLGMTYHIHDIIGAEIVKSIDTTSGKLLRLAG